MLSGPPGLADAAGPGTDPALVTWPDRLAGWCLPLTAIGGRLLAMKGSSAREEVTEHRAALQKLGGGNMRVLTCGTGLIEPETTVVEVIRERAVSLGSRRNRKR